MASNEARTENANESICDGTDDAPLRSIIDTPLTDSLINEIFHQQNQDGSFPADENFSSLFNVNFQQFDNLFKENDFDQSTKDEILRLVSTGSILFYFLFHSQKTNFPVDLTAIQQFINNARSELETFSAKDDPIMQTYIDKGELAVNYVIKTREKYAHLCQQLNLNFSTWEFFIQHLLGLRS